MSKSRPTKQLSPIFIILLLSCFCLLFNRQIEAKSKAALQFSIVLAEDKDEHKLNQPINVSFKLKNTGAKPVYVNKRFYVNSEDSGTEDREVFLRATGPGGEKLEFKRSYDTGFPRTDDFVLLAPQEEIVTERQKNLKAYFEFKTPGEYKITAIYQNIYGAEIGLDAFRDKITSQPVKIKIIE